MKRPRLAALLTAGALSLSAGCTTGGLQTAWSRSISVFERSPGSSAEESEITGTEDNNSVRTKELSPEFREAQKTFRDTERTMLAWANYQEDIGEYAEARKIYRELQIAYPKNIDAHLGLARIEMLTGRTAQAEELLTRLAEKYPDDVDVKLELGRLYARQEDWVKALRTYERACDLAPSDQNCRYELGVVLARQGKFDQSLSHLTFAVGASAAHYNIGYILHEQGDDAAAAEWFQNALQMHPDQRTAEQAKTMLTQLSRSNAAATDDAVVSRGTRTPRAVKLVTRSGSAGQSTQQFADQFEPAAVQPVPRRSSAAVPPGNNYDSSPLMSAGEQHSSREYAAESPVAPSPLRMVSAPDSEGAGRVHTASAEPPLWKGPSAPPQRSSDGASGGQPALNDPPEWNARRQ